MKTKIAANDREITAGGGSEEYKDCLHLKLEWAREAQYRQTRIVRLGGQGYFYKRHDAALGSGVAGGTMAFTDPSGTALPATPPPQAGDTQLTGRDAALFRTKWPVVIDTVRPLPAGEYKFYFVGRPKEYIICDGVPDLEKQRQELFVTVTAPTGTLHEAFFDPATVGNAVAVDSTNGVLKPRTFTGAGGVSATINKIAWESGTVTIGVTPHSALNGHTIDVIELDGSVSLSLNIADATVNPANDTLSWSVASQPWQAGDLLMLRIRKATQTSTATATPTPAPRPAP